MIQEEIQTVTDKDEYKNMYHNKDDYKDIGNYKLLLNWNSYNNGEPILTIGPNYIIFIITFLVVNITSFLVIIHLDKLQETIPFRMALVIIVIFLDIVWLATALINPGIALAAPNEYAQFCKDCQASNGILVAKKLGRVHCQECNVCIDEQENHIKISGGCIGRNNFIVFKLLLLGIFLWGITMITIIPLVQDI